MLKALKLHYKKKLLRRLIIEDDRGQSVVDFLKSVNMKTVTHLIAESWEEIKPDTFRKSWKKIIPIFFLDNFFLGTSKPFPSLLCPETSHEMLPPPVRKEENTLLNSRGT